MNVALVLKCLFFKCYSNVENLILLRKFYLQEICLRNKSSKYFYKDFPRSNKISYE